MEKIIVYRGSVGDLATDVAAVLTPEQARELMERPSYFLKKDRKKFRSPSD